MHKNVTYILLIFTPCDAVLHTGWKVKSGYNQVTFERINLQLWNKSTDSKMTMCDYIRVTNYEIYEPYLKNYER